VSGSASPSGHCRASATGPPQTYNTNQMAVQGLTHVRVEREPTCYAGDRNIVPAPAAAFHDEDASALTRRRLWCLSP